MENALQKLSNRACEALTPCRRRRALLGLPVLLGSFWVGNAVADHCGNFAGELVSVEGDVNIGKLPASMGAEICSDEPITVGSLSRAAVRLADTQTVIRIDQNSTFMIRPSDAERSWLELIRGVIYLFSRQPESLRVDTPYINAVIDGTEFVIEASDERGEVTVIEGSVLVSNEFGQLKLEPGEVASAGDDGDSPRRRVVVDPLDAVQWALHYPPIGATEETSDAVRSAADMLARGNVERAESLLNDAPEDAASLALQAMIAVTRNRSLEAMRLATQAVNANAGSSLAYTALSYAQQAQFEIEQALQSASVAVRNNPTSAFALARQAELELGVDNPAAALRSARMAIEVAPDNSRARTVLGFVRLVRLEVGEAEAAFAEAVTRDPGDPLPRLGLGLATIHDGRLVEGREHLEVAAALDPNNALVRSYLGKAYAEERESGDAAAQFALAQTLDPQDPTSWLYDALLDQTLNRPVSAYRKISKARALNDNRLVYRSRLLVDSDAAAQSISLGRVYSDLGFEQLAINQSSQSLAKDPTNYSAYRFLADALDGRERNALARESVLFRSTLLQPLTINPAQPEAQDTDLLILPGSGPVSASDNEFNPLFDRDGFRLSGSLVYGNQKTLGNQLVLAAKRRKFAYSIGQFHYETDGFRENNDLTHDLVNLQVQYQQSPELSLQADVQARETTSGDVLQSFDPEDLDPTNRLNIQTVTPRIGVRYAPGRRATVLASVRSLQRDEASRKIANTPFGTFIEVAELERDGLEPHLQLMLLGRDANHTIGIEGYRSTSRITRELEHNEPTCPLPSGNCIRDSGDRKVSFINGYYHSDFAYNDSLDLTLGASYTFADDDGSVQELDFTSPKLGLWWRVSPTVDLRTAFVGGMGRGSSSDVTLEPIVIAGFNHLFDDNFGARFQSFSIALDWDVEPGLSLGVETRLRSLKVPITLAASSTDDIMVEDENQDELAVRSYLYWLPSETNAVSASISYELFDRQVLNNPGLQGTGYYEDPSQTTTVTLPVRWRHIRPHGFFVQSTVTFVHQNIDQSPLVESEEDSDSFVDVEISAGRKFGAMRGSFRIDVRNLFDTDYSFQDQSFISSERTSAPRFSAERTVYGRLSFFF